MKQLHKILRFLLVLGTNLALLTPAGASLDEDVFVARAAAEKFLAEAKGSEGRLEQIDDGAVRRLFAKTVFFSIRFRQFPVARIVPAGFNPSNILAVSGGEKPQLLNDASNLETF